MSLPYLDAPMFAASPCPQYCYCGALFSSLFLFLFVQVRPTEVRRPNRIEMGVGVEMEIRAKRVGNGACAEIGLPTLRSDPGRFQRNLKQKRIVT